MRSNSKPMVWNIAAPALPHVSYTNSSPELLSATYLTSLSTSLPPPHPAPTRPIPALPESPTCPGLITPPTSTKKSRKSRLPGAAGNGHKRKSSFQGGGLVLPAPVLAERKMLGGKAASVRFSTVYGNNVLVGEKKIGKHSSEGRGLTGKGMITRMDSLLGRRGTVQMSPLPPVPKIPAALDGGGLQMGGNGFLAVHAVGSGRESLVSLHSTVNGPLPEYFDARQPQPLPKMNSTNPVSKEESLQEIAPTREAEEDDWEAHQPCGGGVRRTHSVRNRSVSRPGKIRARMPSTVSRASSRSSTRSAKLNTPRPIQRTMSGASRKSTVSTYSREGGHGTPRTGTSPYIDCITPKSAGAPFDAPPTPPLPAPITPSPQTPLPAVPTLVGSKRKSRKQKPARIMLPQEILAMEARRESRRDEMRMLVEKQETVMRPIQEAESSCSSEEDNDDDGFLTEDDSPNESQQVNSQKVAALIRDNASSTYIRAVVAAPLPPAPSVARKATPRPNRKPVPSTTYATRHVYSIFPRSPRRGSQGQLIFPPPTLPGTVRRQDAGLKSPGMATQTIPISPLRAPATKSEAAAGLAKSITRTNPVRKSTIGSPTPKIEYTSGGRGSGFTTAPNFDFDYLPLGIALTPLRVPVVVTPGGEIVAQISSDKGGLIIERCEENPDRAEGAEIGDVGKKNTVKEEEARPSILNRPRPKKPQGRPVTRGKSTVERAKRESQVYGFGVGVSATFYHHPDDGELSAEAGTPASPEQRRRSKCDSEIYTLIPPTSSPTCSTSSTPSALEVELTDSTHLDVASIARSSLPGSLRDSFYEELRLKYSSVASGLTNDPDSEEEFVGGVLHMGTPSLDSDAETTDEGSSVSGSPPLPPGSPLKPLRILKVPTIPMEKEEMGFGAGKKEEGAVARKNSKVEVAELDADSKMVTELEASQSQLATTGASVQAAIQRQQTVRIPVAAPPPTRTGSSATANTTRIATLPATAVRETQLQNTNPPSVPRSTSRATINPALDNASSSSSYGPDPNEAFAALQMRTGDPFYSPTSQKARKPAILVNPTYAPISSLPPRPAPQVPIQQNYQHHQPSMLPGMPKRRVELPRFTRTIRHTTASPPAVPVKDTPFFLDVRTPGSKTVYSSSPPLKQEETHTPAPTRTKSPATMKQFTQAPPDALPATSFPDNLRQTRGKRPRATTHSGAPPPIPMHGYPPPPVPPIPRIIPSPNSPTSGRPLPPPPRTYESTMFLNRNSEPISGMNGNEHVLSHYTPGTLITVPNAASPQALHRIDPPNAGHWRSRSSGDDSGHVSHAPSGGAVRHTMKERLGKAFKIGTDRHGVVELGQGEFGGNWVDAQEDGVESKKEVRRHASKPSLGGWGTRLKSGVFGGGQGH